MDVFADMPAAKRKSRTRTTRRSGAFSFGSFVGGVVVGGAIMLAITYPAGNSSMASNSVDAAPIGTPVDIDWEFIDKLADAEVKTGVEPVEQPVAIEPGPKEYVLHAPQFLRHEDAQVLQAELMLDGLPVSVSSSPRARGGSWYRVMVGPYESEGDAQGALNQLRDRDIPAQILARPLPSSDSPTT